MGRRKPQRKNDAVMLDGDDDDEYGSSSAAANSFSTTLSETGIEDEVEELNEDSLLDEAIDALYEKRSAVREKALYSIMESFKRNLQHQFVEKNFAMLLHRCLNSIKKGSSKEICLASHTIALLALTVGSGDNAREILEESLTPLSQALESGTGSDSSKIASLLECLAIVTFVGENPEETERSMQIMWQLVHPKRPSNVSAAVITAVVSAWTLLLTTMDGWELNPKDWQRSISYFSSLLDKDDRSVRIAAGEALAVIFEVGSLEMFSTESLRARILDQVRDLSAEAGGKGTAKKDLNGQRKLFKDVLEFLEDGCSPQTSMKIGRDSLSTCKWSQLIQLNYLKRVLGGGFVKHMQENEFLQDVFGFSPTKRRQHYMSSAEKRYFKSPNSALNKARTKDLNRQRMPLERKQYC